MAIAEIVKKWKSGEKQVDIAKEFDVSEAYISQVLAPFKKVESFSSNSIYLSNMPEEVKIAWNQVATSIESAWGKIKSNGKRKWPSKYAHFLIVKNWIEKQS